MVGWFQEQLKKCCPLHLNDEQQNLGELLNIIKSYHELLY